jgi:hypothetical protein
MTQQDDIFSVTEACVVAANTVAIGNTPVEKGVGIYGFHFMMKVSNYSYVYY